MARPNDIIGWASPSLSSRPNDLTSLQIGDTSPATHVGWDAITIIIIPKIMGVALHQKSNAEGYISKKYKPKNGVHGQAWLGHGLLVIACRIYIL